MVQVFTFRLLSGEDDDFVRDFEIQTDQTFLDFHHAIRKNLHFDPGLLASFFTTDDTWKKGEEIPLMNMTDDPKTKIMGNTHIGDMIRAKGDKLLYLYDNLSNRGFFIDLIVISKPEKGEKYPYCSRSEGQAPAQLLFDELTGQEGNRDFLFDEPDDDLLSEGLENLDDIPDL